MQNPFFKKKNFQHEVKEQLKNLFRTTIVEATPKQLYRAVCYAVKDVVIDNWMLSRMKPRKQDPKPVYYMSMEFLTGRSLGNNLLALQAYKEVREALDEMGINLIMSEDQERDPAL